MDRRALLLTEHLTLMAAAPATLALALAPTLHLERKAERNYRDHETASDPALLGADTDAAVAGPFAAGGGRRVARAGGCG